MDNLARHVETFSMATRKVKPDHGYSGNVPPAHFIAHWRSYRGHSQESTAAAANMVPNNLSQLENYKQGWSPEGLLKIARFLKTHPGALLMINPLLPGEAQFWEAWSDAARQDREFLGAIVPTLLERQKRQETGNAMGPSVDYSLPDRAAATKRGAAAKRPGKHPSDPHGRVASRRR